METRSLQTILDEKLAEAKLKNPAASLRSFSKRLGVSPSTVSELRSGKRKLTPELIERLADRLYLSPSEKATLLAKLPSKKTAAAIPDLASLDNEREELRHDEFEMIAEWYHYGILSLVKLDSFRSDVEWIARHLGIKTREARSALERLERLGLLARDKKGNCFCTKSGVRTSDGVSSMAIRKAHVEGLELARKALEELPVEERDFFFHVVATDKAKLAEAAKRVRSFMNELGAFLDQGPKNDVYRFSFHLFPLTKNLYRNPKE